MLREREVRVFERDREWDVRERDRVPRERDRDTERDIDRGERDFERDDFDNDFERDLDFFPSAVGPPVSDSLLFRPAALLFALVPLPVTLPVAAVLLPPLFVVPALPDEFNGNGIARCMKPPHALWDPLFRSTVMTVGAAAAGLASGRSFLRCSWYFFFKASTASSSCSAFGLPRLYSAMMR